MVNQQRYQMKAEINLETLPLSDQYFRCITADYSLKSGNSVAMSRISSEEELRMMLDIEDEDTDHNKTVLRTPERCTWDACIHSTSSGHPQ